MIMKQSSYELPHRQKELSAATAQTPQESLYAYRFFLLVSNNYKLRTEI